MRFPHICLFVTGVCALGCSGYSATGGPGPLVKSPLATDVSEDFAPLRVNQVLIAPLASGPSLELPEDEMKQIDQRLAKAFDLQTSLTVINTSDPQVTRQALRELGVGKQTVFDRASALGKRVGAQGVLCGVLNHYVASDGSRYGASRVADVQFRLWLVDPESKQALWSATFDGKNQPLSENLFRIKDVVKRGSAPYMSAPQLVDEGFRAAASSLEELRQGTE